MTRSTGELERFRIECTHFMPAPDKSNSFTRRRGDAEFPYTVIARARDAKNPARAGARKNISLVAALGSLPNYLRVSAPPREKI